MDEPSTSYLLPSLEVRWIPAKARYGVFARAPIPAGTVLTVWGGSVMPAGEFLRLPLERQPRGHPGRGGPVPGRAVSPSPPSTSITAARRTPR